MVEKHAEHVALDIENKKNNMKKTIKPNEIIGLTFTLTGLILVVISVTHGSIKILIAIGLCAIFSTIFLSIWGLTTFNDLFEKRPRFSNEALEPAEPLNNLDQMDPFFFYNKIKEDLESLPPYDIGIDLAHGVSLSQEKVTTTCPSCGIIEMAITHTEYGMDITEIHKFGCKIAEDLAKAELSIERKRDL